jgi:hypothetical protein
LKDPTLFPTGSFLRLLFFFITWSHLFNFFRLDALGNSSLSFWEFHREAIPLLYPHGSASISRDGDGSGTNRRSPHASTVTGTAYVKGLC